MGLPRRSLTRGNASTVVTARPPPEAELAIDAIRASVERASVRVTPEARVEWRGGLRNMGESASSCTLACSRGTNRQKGTAEFRF